MSRLIVGISGVLALSLISGAAELASGRGLSAIAGDHTTIAQSLSLPSSSPAGSGSSVNRGSKADRAASPAGSPAQTRTVSLQLNGFSDTTFLVRVPVAISTPPSAPSPVKPAIRRTMVACEPVVSVLAEVARQLQPGRCIT
jgi:hypothetical protein